MDVGNTYTVHRDTISSSTHMRRLQKYEIPRAPTNIPIKILINFVKNPLKTACNLFLT